MVLLSVLPLRVATPVGEHPNLEALRKLLTLASDKWGLYAVLDVSKSTTSDILFPLTFSYLLADVISDCAAFFSIFLPDAGVAQRQFVGEFAKLKHKQMRMC